jgi:hemolysin activation/secretion protein
VGRGDTLGFRAIITLPPGKDFYQSFNFGLDYKRTTQLTLPRQVEENIEDEIGRDISPELAELEATYYPLVLAYSGTWSKKGMLTELNLGVTLGLRGAGGSRQDFDNFRFRADRNFLALRGDLSHTRDLPYGFEVSGLVQGQLADQPLINTEQFAAGGLGTVRGYLEATALGDNAALASLELRSPSLLGALKKEGNEWRIYTFIEGAVLTLREALPEQTDRFELASYGIGSSLNLFNFLNASIDVGIPLIDQNNAGPFEEPRNVAGKPLVTFRVWAEF